MDKYTYADVIIDPADPRVEIGAEYYFGNNPTCLLKDISQLSAHEGRLTIVDIGKDICSAPFIADTQQPFVCLIRKKEPSYEERQAEWAKTNDIKVGDKVRIIKEFPSEEGFCDFLKTLVGTIGEIKEITDEYIQVYTENKSDWWYWRYDCLEKVEEPEFKVGDFVKDKDGNIGIIKDFFKDKDRMFAKVRYNNLHSRSNRIDDLAKIKAHLEPFPLYEKETRELLRDRYVQYEANGFEPIESPISTFHLCDGAWAIVLPVIGYLNSQNFLDKCKFLDGTPCGLVVEDE